jgi:UPF0716 family protein affecting phage T7 exclusion
LFAVDRSIDNKESLPRNGILYAVTAVIVLITGILTVFIGLAEFTADFRKTQSA